MENVIDNLTDKDLAAAVRNSDAGAFKTLYYRYYDALYQFLYSKCRSSELARDLLQEVFTRIWQTRARINPEQSIKAYLYRIANNLSIDHMRKKVRERKYQVEMNKQGKQNARDLEMSITIRKAIENLPEKYRLVFQLSRFEGLTYAEISAVCKISIKTVESRMSRALQILRKALK
jgi:RNA polymerase sigma-70 factor (ECF subfamily)